MKKYFVFAFIAVAAIALSSCNNNNNGGGNTPTGEYTIALNPKSLELAIGDEAKVKATVTPKDAKVVYKSTNEEVATVSGGLVTGISEGEALIIASIEGQNVADTCVVTVKPWYDVLSWNGWTLWDLDKSTVLSTDTAIFTLRSGEEVHCVLIPGTFHVWDDGIVMTGNSVSGYGNVIIADAPIYLILDSLDENGPSYYYLGTSSLSFVDPELWDPTDTAYAYCAAANAYIDGKTAQDHYNWLTDTTGNVKPAIAGIETTFIYAIDYDNQEVAAGYVGLVGTSIFGGDDNEHDPLYIANMGWFQYGQWGYMGLAMDENNPGQWKEPYEWDEIIEKSYEKLNAASAPQYVKMAPPAELKGDFKVTRNMGKKQMYKK